VRGNSSSIRYPSFLRGFTSLKDIPKVDMAKVYGLEYQPRMCTFESTTKTGAFSPSNPSRVAGYYSVFGHRSLDNGLKTEMMK
jgi:hypothetical protein